MKIAVFADVHGNLPALQAVLDDLDRQNPDAIVCAGDAVNPLPDSSAVLSLLAERNIPLVRGNHEDYMLGFHHPNGNGDLRDSVQFMPVQCAARRLSAADLATIAALPLTHTVSGPDGDDVLVCHGSPTNPARSFSAGIDDAMAAELAAIPARTIIGGHVHMQWQMRWRDKFLVLTGSAGQPFGENTDAQYLMLSHWGGRWHAKHRTVRYNLQDTVRRIAESNFLVEGGPMAWLTLDELLCAELRMVPFLRKFCPTPRPVSLADWAQWVRRYLEAIGRWDALQPLIGEAYALMMSSKTSEMVTPSRGHSPEQPL